MWADEGPSVAETDGGRHEVDDSGEKRGVVERRGGAGQRVFVGEEGRVELGPVVCRQDLFSQREDLALLQAHVREVEVDISRGGSLERLSPRFAEHLESQQRVFELADVAFSSGVIAVQVVEQVT